MGWEVTGTEATGGGVVGRGGATGDLGLENEVIWDLAGGGGVLSCIFCGGGGGGAVCGLAGCDVFRVGEVLSDDFPVSLRREDDLPSENRFSGVNNSSVDVSSVRPSVAPEFKEKVIPNFLRMSGSSEDVACSRSDPSD